MDLVGFEPTCTANVYICSTTTDPYKLSYKGQKYSIKNVIDEQQEKHRIKYTDVNNIFYFLKTYFLFFHRIRHDSDLYKIVGC